ncbi:hypothetical protein AVEN_50794-1 [Araneus ventricosus]|uniref:Uncharacterized protein n=1 Tax=Araneus ventricosus TaxID=182803 RepID=A0A4Y2IUS9_ARAVE|nr:hypothetical protein AVEN_50794-1 [Araneus ventricosus]
MPTYLTILRESFNTGCLAVEYRTNFAATSVNRDALRNRQIRELLECPWENSESDGTVQSERRQQQYKDLVAEYSQRRLSAAPAVNTRLPPSSMMPSTTVPEAPISVSETRPKTRSQKRLLKIEVPDPPPNNLLLTSSDSSVD